MIKLDGIKLDISSSEELLKVLAAEKLRTRSENISKLVILKKSLDARRKDSLKNVYAVAVSLFDEKGIKIVERIEPDFGGIEKIEASPLDKNKRYAIVGSGPAGLFCAMTILKRGAIPVIFERGYDVDRRTSEVEKFILTDVLNEECNVQFGEGGAGTYSDGKLNTGTKSPYIKTVLKEFVDFGAPKEILYLNKPHIGTDVLRTVVKNMREGIKSLGGEFRFGTAVTDFSVKNGEIDKLRFVGEQNGEEKFDGAVFAIGHSARDTFEMLFEKGVAMERKPFSVGARVEHLQSEINKAQYGVENSPFLPPADYRLAAKTKDGRGVYSFCMCPGGEVVAAASERGMMTTNGMSLHSRNGTNANAAILVSVEPSDFGDGGVLQGVEFQRRIEKKVFELCNGYKGIAQRYVDLAAGRKTTRLGAVTPSIRTGFAFEKLTDCLPSFVTEGLVFGMERFGKSIDGFDSPDAIFVGAETRSSSPVRILRDAFFQSSVRKLYPCGEGAGYAGGITSSAVDGIKCGLAIE